MTGKTFVHTTTTKTITPQQFARIQQHQRLIQQQQQQQQHRQPQQQQQQQQQGQQQPQQKQQQQQQQQQQSQGKTVAQPALRKVVSSPATQQKQLPAGTKVGQQRITQTLTLTRPVQQHQQQQQMKRLQLPTGQQVTSGVVTQTGTVSELYIYLE